MGNRVVRTAAAIAILGMLAAPRSARAQTDTPGTPPVLLVLDKDAIDFGPAPHLLPEGAVDPDLAGVGVREELPYFQGHVNGQVVLTSGQNGSGGWFAIRSVPASWASVPGGADGLQNFALAGPGLGSPDEEGDREALLDAVADVAPLGADGLALLVGRSVCAVIYSGDVTVAPGSPVSLKGPTLGRIAFTVVGVLPGSVAAFPNVQVQIAEGHEVCSGALVPFADAPAAAATPDRD
jgi:molybdopterin-binding protein